MAQPRYFQNPYLNEKEGELPLEASEEIRSNLKQESNRLLKILHTSLPPNVSQKRFTVYTGSAGMALLHLILYWQTSDKENLSIALDYLDASLSTVSQLHKKMAMRPRTSFIEGEAGIFALAAVLNALKQPEMQRNEWVEQLLGLQKFVLEKHNTENEVLYGRAGYLYALLFVDRHVPLPAERKRDVHLVMKRVVDAIFENGVRNATSEAPLMFQWHDKVYLGAAHGFSGILSTIMLYHKRSPNSFCCDTVNSRNLEPGHWTKIKLFW